MKALARQAVTWCVALAPLVPARAVTLAESFSTNPLARGWAIFGDTNLFQWDGPNQNLRVTWDSSRTNSYFHLPLGTILSRSDDFALEFDLRFTDYVIGTNPGKPGTFEAAIGLLNLAQAEQANFNRGAGTSQAYGPRNLVEFDFFPAYSMAGESFSPTIAQTMVGTNTSWLFNHDNLQDLLPGQLFGVTMNYRAASRSLTTTVTNQGAQYGATQVIIVPTNFDFRVTAFAISSYSEQRADGSILAHGVVDDISVTLPPPPIQNLTGTLTNGLWRVQFLSRSNWLYTLERSFDCQSWTSVTGDLPGNATNLVWLDPNPATNGAVYRVKAQRP